MRRRLALALTVFSLSALAADEVYRWVDKQGVVHYGAQPPNKDAKPVALPALQTYKAGSKVPLPSVAQAPKILASEVKEVRITAPVQDEIFRDPAGLVNVSVAVVPGLPAGAGIVFYLDGSPKNAKPLSTTSTSFTGVERGEHSVSAAVVDATGKELGRAPPITFYTRPPGLKP